MKTDTAEKIMDYIQKQKYVSPKELVEYFNFSPQAIFRQLKKLYKAGLITKMGSSPKVFYTLAKDLQTIKEYVVAEDIRTIIDQHYYIVTPLGQEKIGVDGFEWWCQRQGLDIVKTATEYIRTLQKYNQYRQANGLISGLQKLQSAFKHTYLDALFYLDFYAIERFGKTKLGQLLILAKQSQNRVQIKILIDLIVNQIKTIIDTYEIKCIGFIPPTVKREIQIMNEFKRYLHCNLPVLKITKVKTPIIVPQKTLSKLNDRIENARNTMIVEDERKFRNILLIDDAVGSGATLNETSRHIQEKGLCQGKIIGIAITGSFKGFEVISEV